MTDLFSWDFTLAVLGLTGLAGLLSALRLSLARASRPAVDPVGLGSSHQPSERDAPPIRARVLGALLVGSIVLNAAAAVIVTVALARVYSDRRTILLAVPTVAALVVGAEALARLCATHGLVPRALRPFGIRLDRYVQKLTATEEIRGQVDLLHRQGDVVKAERDMLGGLLDLGELTVSEVMVHRTRMRMLDADLAAAELVRDALASPYTRMPMWRGEPENIVGVLHAKDLLRAVERNGRRGLPDAEAIATPPWFVPDTTSLRDQLKAFLARKQHFALVVDEYGALMGLVTLEDILEEIVGEISDEHDVVPRGVRPQPDGSVIVDGSLPIRDLNRTMDWALPDEEATTIAGLVIHEAQAIPEAGQVFTFHGFRFEVLRRVRNRIAALRIAPAARPAAQEAEAA